MHFKVIFTTKFVKLSYIVGNLIKEYTLEIKINQLKYFYVFMLIGAAYRA